MGSAFIKGKLGDLPTEGPAWNDRPVSVAGVYIIRVNGVGTANHEIWGDFLNTKLYEQGQFQSYFQLFSEIQKTLDREGCPQRSSDPHSMFHKPRLYGRTLPPIPALESLPFTYDPISPKICGRVRRGRYALFFLRIISRHNATWQGHLYWADQRVGGYFRSVMELCEMMDEVVQRILRKQAAPPRENEAPRGGPEQTESGEEDEYEP